MADTRARASFLAVPRATEEGRAFSAAHTPRSRVLHARRTPRGSQGSPEQAAQEPAFVFATPGAAVGGQKAARSTKRKSAIKGRTPADTWPSPLEGSPMQWSPMDNQDADTPEPAQPRPQQPQPAHRAGGSVAEADHVAVELNTRLHLSGLENLPHELQSRLNFAHSQQGTKQPVPSPAQRPAQAQPQPLAGHSNPAGVQQVPAVGMEEAAAELASRFQEVHVAPTAEQARSEAVAASLASQLEHLQVASNAHQQQQQPHPSGDTAGPDGQQTVPPEAPAVPTGFVFAAGAANSPVQRQGKAASSVRKSQAARSIGAQKAGGIFAASSKPLASGAAQPAVPPHTAADANPAPVSFLPARPSAAQPLSGGSQLPNANAPSASQPSFHFSSGPSTANPASQSDLGSGFALLRQKQSQEQQGQQHQEEQQPQEPPPLAAARKQQPQEVQHPVDRGATEAQAGPRPQPPTAFSFVVGMAVEGRAPTAAGQAPAFAFGTQSAGSSEGGPASFIFGSGRSGQRTAAPDNSGGGQQQHVAPQPFTSSGGLAARRVLRKGASSSPASQGPRTGTGTAAQPGKYSDEEKKQQSKEALQKEMSASAFCETFRIQGNEAFKNSKYEEALEHYTKAMKALWPCPNLHPLLAPLYSNRAAALLSLGKPWQALQDCQSGLKCDPKFTRCGLRIATCYYRLGDFATAERHLDSMQQAAGNAIVLAEIDSKRKEVMAYRDQVFKVLDLLGHPVPAGRGRPDAVSSRRQAAGQRAMEGGLAELEKLRAHVPHAEYLQAARAQALLRLGRYTEAKASTEAHVHFDEAKVPTAKQPWQYWLEAQCAFHEGEHAKELSLLQGLAQHTKQAVSSSQDAADLGSKQETGPPGLLEAVVPLPSTHQVQEAIASAEAAQKLRQQGNELMKQRKFTEAVQKYSEALATPGLSAAFAAILYSNRAAAHQGLQQLAQAVADCCRSKALAPAYAKAHSRLAALLSTLRLHSAAVRSLEAALHTPGLASADRRDYETRLREARAAAQRKSPGGGGQPQPDHYKLLGIERDCTVEDVRKAYKRLALHLHPDKVVSHCRYTAQLTEVGAIVLPAEAAQGRLQEDAKWLFQCLGEAHEVLQDKSKREDLDFELRMDERYGSSSSSYGDPYFGGFGYYGERHYGPGQRSGASGGGYSPGGSFADRVRRAAQQRQQGNGSRGFSGYGWG